MYRIAILMIGAKATEDTPAMLYNQVQNAAWMVPIVSGVIFFIPLLSINKNISLFKDKNLFAVIQQLLGKYIGFIVCLLIFVINSSAIAFDSRDVCEYHWIVLFYNNTKCHNLCDLNICLCLWR